MGTDRADRFWRHDGGARNEPGVVDGTAAPEATGRIPSGSPKKFISARGERRPRGTQNYPFVSVQFPFVSVSKRS